MRIKRLQPTARAVKIGGAPRLSRNVEPPSSKSRAYTQAKDAAMPNTAKIVHSDPEILGGTPVFVGTRVPVKSLYDYLEAGDSLDEFLDSFPSVSREQAIAALELAREMTEAHVAAPR